MQRIGPAGLVGIVAAEADVPVAGDRLERLPVGGVAFGRQRDALLGQVRIGHDLDQLAAARRRRDVSRGERQFHPELVERHHFLEDEKFEFFVVALDLGPYGHVRKRARAVEAKLEAEVVVYGQLQRLVGVEPAFAGVEEYFRRFIVVEHVVGILPVVVGRRQPNRETVCKFVGDFVGRETLIRTSDQ